MNGRDFATKAEKVPRVEGTVSMERDVLTKDRLLKFCLALAETALQLVRSTSKEGR